MGRCLQQDQGSNKMESLGIALLILGGTLEVLYVAEPSFREDAAIERSCRQHLGHVLIIWRMKMK